ncbi:acetyltransferase, gnat family [Melioribacter roseus P3M-2]|uniref:Acetyltransferase, gnat family n=1 Tax=Melioribacter roseus (strain DSM 23840 / JCM 17771 / VKM B-2668 / P3M-2) TaxID=1191523 RepID=I6Z7C3_MELRP|nr:GNAT family N-acetyltransferase [Melioribacter roseus]AFN75060.1 acetyltransferase, gnat family [Melioribacter roseus P3M-2]
MIRKLQSDDRKRLVEIIDGTKNFSKEEKKIAVELIDEALEKDGVDNYNVFVYLEGSEIAGYHCIGRRPLTDGVFDLYWIVVDKKFQNKGIGKKLLDHAEEFAINNNGRWILAETSSQDNYNETRNFYFRNNYSIVAEIKDFYKPNDNLIVFGKYIKK